MRIDFSLNKRTHRKAEAEIAKIKAAHEVLRQLGLIAYSVPPLLPEVTMLHCRSYTREDAIRDLLHWPEDTSKWVTPLRTWADNLELEAQKRKGPGGAGPEQEQEQA